MTDHALDDLPAPQAELLVPDFSNRNRRRVAGDSLKRYPRDPLVLLPEFQHWALQRIRREREADGLRPARASAAIEFDCVES